MKSKRANSIRTLSLIGKSKDKPHFDISKHDSHLDSSPHRHQFLEIVFFTKGTGSHTIAGNSHPINAGSVFFLLPHHIHQLEFSQEASFFLLAFDIRFLRPELHIDINEIESLNLNRTPELAVFLYQTQFDYFLAHSSFELVKTLCAKMLDEKNSPRLCSDEILRSSLMLLITEVSRCYEQDLIKFISSEILVQGIKEAVSKAIVFIRENLHRPIRLHDVAKHVFLSPTYLTSLLKKETGKTFLELLTEKRIEKSTELLLFTDQSIFNIALEVGYEDSTYFSRRFKSQIGLSPRLYRSKRHHRKQFLNAIVRKSNLFFVLSIIGVMFGR